MKKNKSFTIMELLIVMTIVVILLILSLLFLNPKKQIEKAHDAKKINDLDQIKKVLENYYDDKNCYPKPEEICYQSAPYNNACYICGNNFSSPLIPDYFNKIPCDPQSPQKNYLYQVDNQECPKWFKIYAFLSNNNNHPAVKNAKCEGYACGIQSPNNNLSFGYNYGISSGNVDLDRSSTFYCCYIYQNKPLIKGCNVCSNTYDGCLSIEKCIPNEIYANLSLCQKNCK